MRTGSWRKVEQAAKFDFSTAVFGAEVCESEMSRVAVRCLDHRMHLRDSGLLHTLLGIGDLETLLGQPVVGSSWEGVLIENILSTVPATAQAWFYRTIAGAEIDLVLEVGPRQRWAIEIKRCLGGPKPSKGFYPSCAENPAVQGGDVERGERSSPCAKIFS